jgi:hypothetical protein
MSLPVAAPQPSPPALIRLAVPPSLAQGSRCGRSFPGQPTSTLSLALANRLLQEFWHPAGASARNHPATTRKIAGAITGYSAAMEASSCFQQTAISGATISPPSLAQASPLRKEFRQHPFIRHALLPCSSIYFINSNKNLF